VENPTSSPSHQEQRLSLADIAHSALFDYEVRRVHGRYNHFYDFIAAYPKIFDQPWQTTPEIEECIIQLASANYASDEEDYTRAQGLRHKMLDAFYAVNKSIMDVICLAFRLFVTVKRFEKKEE
jgi:hypothetical protein